ncbi:golgin IMH1-like isoform X1 [Camellia sinensis]|uniref:golgin IMH1-like isoform X1 n=1 Tax=Camellia sinensis TaxID=4442 RepID=UPI0010369874|nr:golgin IMH1-like isoform X1 [Camellia sinensis]XP_028120640.1 golgin IMH1-like isoform X1 [Camellia sinensis]XP_028120641.1 golgin IMH1-like isoform X1 [Camellia sinensis]
MEDEKKKKKNKKKKNKQSKTTGDVTDGIGESANADQSHAIEQNHHNGTEGANLEEMIKKLQKENDNCIQKEDKTSVQLYKLHAGIEEAIEKLQNENEAHILEEARLEETIKKLEKENDTHMQKEAFLEMKLLQLQSEKDSWLQKEVGFEEKINQLMDETSTLSLKRVSLEEKIKQLEGEIDYWFQKENSTEETIAKLNGDNTRLQAQVMESEESRNNLLQENQWLTESMSGMKFRIQNLETASTRTSTVMTMHASESEDMNVQTKAAQPLVENLVAKNSELVEKVINYSFQILNIIKFKKKISKDGVP